jgi:glycosyltransferase involved in cell wall biosynthesis
MNSKPKVGYVLTPISFGGSERVSLNYLKNANHDEFDIHPILLTRPWEEEPFFAKEIRAYGYSFGKVPVAFRESGDPLRVLRAFIKLYSYAKAHTFDLIHTHGYFADICGLPTARLLRVPSISTCHGYINNDVKLRLYNRLDLFALKLSHRVFCVSGEIRDLLIGGGVSGDQIRVIRNAVELNGSPEYAKRVRENSRSTFGIKDGEVLLGFCGRLSAEKGISFLVEAVALLNAANLAVKLMIIGDGPERPRIDDLIVSKGMENQIIFTGFREDARELLAALDVFILPSLTEGTPMALLEAMAWGLPVVASAVGEIPEIIGHGDNGILVTPCKVNEIVEAIRNLLENHALRKKLSKAAYSTIESRFGLKQWVQEVERNYLELIQNKRAEG